MPKTNLKIRGIYATALTQLVLDLGYRLVQPSTEIVERFEIPTNCAEEDIAIVDRNDKQGIRVSGRRLLLEELIQRLWEVLLDMVVRRESIAEERAAFDIEFPGTSKTILDSLRARVFPTLRDHHRLRIIASDYLDLIERQIERTPHRKEKLERELMERFIFQPLRKQGILQVEHVKPEGETLRLREGEIVSIEGGKLILRRQFQKGRYDGLNLPIESGDYGISEVITDAWSLRHRYFSEGGELKGEYWNVNTPVELYPDRIRYVDLHVDVVRRTKEAPRAIDRKKLESLTRKGLISSRCRKKAMEVADHLLQELEGCESDSAALFTRVRKNQH
jgi:hypothetical protein